MGGEESEGRVPEGGGMCTHRVRGEVDVAGVEDDVVVRVAHACEEREASMGGR